MNFKQNEEIVFKKHLKLLVFRFWGQVAAMAVSYLLTLFMCNFILVLILKINDVESSNGIILSAVLGIFAILMFKSSYKKLKKEYYHRIMSLCKTFNVDVKKMFNIN